MLDCHCGKPVRLGGSRITVNRRRGVYHYIVHRDETKACGGPWEAVALKPYPARDEDREWFKLIKRWDAAQSSQVGKSEKS